MKKVGCLSALLLLTGCITAQERAEQMRPAMVAEDDHKLHCDVGHDHIEITIPADFPPEIRSMAIIQNGKTRKWRTIVDEENHLAPFKPGVRQIILRPSIQQAVDYRNGRKRLVKAFPTSGEYEIIFTDNTETELENMLSVSCDIILP